MKDTSAIAKANAINDSTKFHGVTAKVKATEANLGTVSATLPLMVPTTSNINGVKIIGVNPEADDAQGTSLMPLMRIVMIPASSLR